jgi:hypothetical protein
MKMIEKFKQLFKNVKGFTVESMKSLLIGVIIAIIAVILIFVILASLAPTLLTSADTMNNSGLPMASLFARDGILILVFVVAVFIAILLGIFLLIKKQ